MLQVHVRKNRAMFFCKGGYGYFKDCAEAVAIDKAIYNRILEKAGMCRIFN